jgi:hypothetical protein
MQEQLELLKRDKEVAGPPQDNAALNTALRRHA